MGLLIPPWEDAFGYELLGSRLASSSVCGLFDLGTTASPCGSAEADASDRLERAYTDQVVAEIDMLAVLSQALDMAMFRDGPIRNALVESFVIRARNIMHFLYPTRPLRTDVLAEHFYADPNFWCTQRGGVPPVLMPLQRLKNQPGAHVSLERLDSWDEARNWDFVGICCALLEKIHLFEETRRHRPSVAADLNSLFDAV